MIDEFQDTDGGQWTIFNRVFGEARDEDGEPTHWLYLIGDPKQAIYSFRGADLNVYLAARRVALEQGHETTLDRNFRSDGRLVHALNALFRDHEGVFAQPGALRYQPVGHALDWSDRYSGHANEAALTVRVVDAGSDSPRGTGPLRLKTPAEELTAKIVADDIRRQLEASPRKQIEGRDLEPGDFAVLVRAHHQAERVERCLRQLGVPCVRSANGNVFRSDEAAHLQDFLLAVDNPRDPVRARALARTPLGGWSGAAIAAAFEGRGEEEEWARWLGRIDGWSQQTRRGGFARAFSQVLRAPDFIERITRFADAERRLTNYRHLVELVHAAETEQRLGPAALHRWLRDQAESDGERNRAAELRLESDADAVQIVTVHSAKGLQYPRVYLPYLWSSSSDQDHLLTYPGDGERVIDLRPHPGQAAKDAAARELRREDLRLLYVAMTRARHTVTAYWTAQYTSRSKKILKAPLTEVLFGGNPEGRDRREFAQAQVSEALESEAPPFEALAEPLNELVEAGRAGDDQTIACEHADAPASERWQADLPARELAPARHFPQRGLEPHWRRLSYSSLTAFQHAPHPVAQRTDPGITDIRPDDVPLGELVRDGRDFTDGSGAGAAATIPGATAPRDETTGSTREVPLAPFPAGPEPGTFVHRVLELIDFATTAEMQGRRRELGALLRDLGPRYGVTRGDHLALLEAALPGILAQPLGDTAGGVALREISPADRLDELAFDLALRGGDAYDPERDEPARWREWRDILCSERPPGSGVPESYLAQLRDDTFSLNETSNIKTVRGWHE